MTSIENKYLDDPLVSKAINYLETETGKNLFEPLEFLNLFMEQRKFIIDNFDNAGLIIDTLKSLPLTQKQRQLLVWLIYNRISFSTIFWGESDDKIELGEYNL
jgi:hypothetical protein